MSEKSVPPHLRKYVVEQNYDRYTPEDQAVWRFIMRQLKSFLSRHAHGAYVSGLKKTGISLERIPRIEEMNRLLADFGWGAVPVSGFIPPAAFMEFQSLGFLPIASDMRTLDHLLYTPAPDIVHEAGGHAPILVDPDFAAYLKKYASVARYAIISKEDMDQYEAIRVLSDVKEDPTSTTEDIAKAEARLNEVNANMTGVSEAALLSRMNWWTAEYGLIGDLKNPKIFGAGLLSSVGESKQCLGDTVRKIPLDVSCVDVSYDITEPQPQLFVTPDFPTLHTVLDALADRLSFRRGGIFGLKTAKDARTVNSVEFNSGLQISGLLTDFRTIETENSVAYLRFQGPCQLSLNEAEIDGQGVARHAQGYSTPVGPLKNGLRLATLSPAEAETAGLKPGHDLNLEYASGIHVEGRLESWLWKNDRLLILTVGACTVTWGDELLFDPSWGEFDLAIGEEIVSVFGGPADRARYGDTDDFVAKRVPAKKHSPDQMAKFSLYQDIRMLREQPDKQRWKELCENVRNSPYQTWLMAMELLEIGYQMGMQSQEMSELKLRLQPKPDESDHTRECLSGGLAIADQVL